MLDQRGFDCWSGDYDRSVSISEERNTYPFAGYGRILERIYRKIMEKSGAKVLDVGFGTGTLTNRLYQNGCRITGVDFFGTDDPYRRGEDAGGRTGAVGLF